jgi:ligand-binding SRPBCC domain-containing protein
MHELERETWLAQPLERVFGFFAQAENLETITPPWLQFRILTPKPVDMRAGATITYKLRVRGLPLRWLTEIEEWNPPYRFVDVQKKGPYRVWRHTHTFSEHNGGTKIVDRVEYELPFGPLGRLVHAVQVRRDVETIFDYREQRIRQLFPAHP